MKNDVIPQSLRFVYASHETPQNPFVGQLQQFCRVLPELLNTENIIGSISYSYAKRMICTDDTCALDHIQPETLVEIVDYDPYKQIFVLMGNTQPSTNAPVHWLIQRAREDVHIVLFLSKDHMRGLIKTVDLPTTTQEYPPGSLEITKEILRTLKTGSIVKGKNQGGILVANNFQELQTQIQNLKKRENK